jgi:hypothetical protein
MEVGDAFPGNNKPHHHVGFLAENAAARYKKNFNTGTSMFPKSVGRLPL